MDSNRPNRITKALEIAARVVLALLAVLAMLVICVGMINPFAEGGTR